MLEVLTEVVGAEELFPLALPEFVCMIEVLGAGVPLRWVGIFFAAVAAHISIHGPRSVKCGLDFCQNGARPVVAAEMERVLVSFGFVQILEAIRAIGTAVLLL